MNERWQDSAACRGVNIERIYGSAEEMKRFRKQYCWESCKVRKECLAMALEFNDDYGVWGGYLPHESIRGASTPYMRERMHGHAGEDG